MISSSARIEFLVEEIAERFGLDPTGDLEVDLERILGALKDRDRTARIPKRSVVVRRGRKPWPEKLREVFHARFMAAMKARCGDHRAIADAIGVQPDNVYRMVRGIVAPSVPQLVVIADKLQVSTDWLLGRRKDLNG